MKKKTREKDSGNPRTIVATAWFASFNRSTKSDASIAASRVFPIFLNVASLLLSTSVNFLLPAWCNSDLLSEEREAREGRWGTRVGGGRGEMVRVEARRTDGNGATPASWKWTKSSDVPKVGIRRGTCDCHEDHIKTLCTEVLVLHKGSRSTEQYLSRIASFRGDRTGAFAFHHWTALGRISFPFWLSFARLHHQPSEPK